MRLRAELLRRVRSFFDERGFLEVETPVLSADIVVDRHLDPFATILAPDPRSPEAGHRLWLQTSPEYHMKRLLAADSGPIYQITRVFRNGEIGPLHNPEFTMLEWYQPGISYPSGRNFLAQLVEYLFNCAAADQLTYRQVFQMHVGLDPHQVSGQQLAQAAARLGISAPASLSLDDRDSWLDLLFSQSIVSHLGQSGPTILYDYPASQAALAAIGADSQGTLVAERFELFMAGVELANGYHELLDAEVLAERTRQNNRLRSQDGKPELPPHSRLLAAMEAGLPDSVGVALGLDRLLMLIAGLDSVADTLAFPIDEA